MISRILTILLVTMALLMPATVEAKKKSSKKTKRAKTEEVQGVRRCAPIMPEDESRLYDKGLTGNVIALWPSHGKYFDVEKRTWDWQRPRLFGTVEDLLTHSFVTQFLVPMLENSGAYVMMPRERDWNQTEVVVDADGGHASDSYKERDGAKKWKQGEGAGFGYVSEMLAEKENPFATGTYREVDAVNEKDAPSTASWSVTVPKAGEYAIYISYKTLPKSASAVHYEVRDAAGKHQYVVNQKQGGGTWMYLGKFQLREGNNENLVNVTNRTAEKGVVVTADAIKVGGGMGNVARRVKGADNEGMVSGLPRYAEAARYFLQWSGVPDSIYSQTKGERDYTDDIRARGNWVNWLLGGTSLMPDSVGLGINVNMSLAIHTDANSTHDDSTVGTLGIYSTKRGKNFPNGESRMLSRDLLSEVTNTIISDVRRTYEPHWASRGIVDKSYYEARQPQVPAVLVEILSHENVADMRSALDPMFRFVVSRAIYKAILKFQADREGRTAVVQPLPVRAFAITPANNKQFKLTWAPTRDSLCSNADATRYIVMERVDGEDAFREILRTSETEYTVQIKDNKLHSYRIIAENDGGRSFPSETLSLGLAAKSRGMALVVNGFTRVSGPMLKGRDTDYAGFDYASDHGVPWGADIHYTGEQFNFNLGSVWRNNDVPGFGGSRNDFEAETFVGNTFDYPAVHGRAIMEAGLSFVSQSLEAAEVSDWHKYRAVDIILGKQCTTVVGTGKYQNRYEVLPKALREAIERYTLTCETGGLLLSGAYIGKDLKPGNADEEGSAEFAERVLGYKLHSENVTVSNELRMNPTKFAGMKSSNFLKYNNELNNEIYCVELPDAIDLAADKENGDVMMRYKSVPLAAAVAVKMPQYKVVTMAVPFETIAGTKNRNGLMRQIMQFLTSGK